MYGTFTDVTPNSGIADSALNRGLAYADIDADGDLDLVISAFNLPNTTDSVKLKPARYLSAWRCCAHPNQASYRGVKSFMLK